MHNLKLIKKNYIIWATKLNKYYFKWSKKKIEIKYILY